MSSERPTFGSLFAGIGGIDLGLERAGWECRWQVEWDAFCQHVLAHHWPDVPRHGDITRVDWSAVEPVDLLAGGFPCQPVSAAGKQAAQEDARWLWPEFHRAIRALRPPLVLVENVTNLLAINDGSAFSDVLGDLAASGYDAEWDCVPASAIGALHERDRVWIVAYPNREGLEGRGRDRREVGQGANQRPAGSGGPVPDSDSIGRDGWTGFLGSGWRRQLANVSRWEPEPDVGRVAHGVPARVDRLRALGNAVVPQVVEVIGRQLIERMDDGN